MEEILIEEYNYPLPDERIAKYPLSERDQSKLLVYRDGEVSEDKFCHVGEYVPASSLLIYNNTRVIQARLEFHKEAGDEAIRREVHGLRFSALSLWIHMIINCHWEAQTAVRGNV